MLNLTNLLHQFNVLFPKIPHHNEEENYGIKSLVLRYLHMDGEISNNYITTEDIEKRKEKLRGYKFC